MTAAPGVRLTGGRWRGRKLRVPRGGVRPTAGRIREALFAIWGQRVAGCRFLDLFAGSGAVGLEALSRGAAAACLVESDPRAVAAIEANRATLDAAGEVDVTVERRHLPAGLRRLPPVPYDLVFADPPYRFAGYRALLAEVGPWLAAGGELAIEHAARRPDDGADRDVFDGPVAGWLRVDQRRYGEVALSLFRAAGC